MLIYVGMCLLIIFRQVSSRAARPHTPPSLLLSTPLFPTISYALTEISRRPLMHPAINTFNLTAQFVANSASGHNNAEVNYLMWIFSVVAAYN